MARVPDQDFDGFLNNLQDWELSVKNKDKKLKSQSDGKEKMGTSAQKHSVTNGSQLSGHGRPGQSEEHGSGRSQKIRVVGENRRTMEKSPSTDNSSVIRQYDYLRNYDEISRLSSGFMTKDSSVDANSEKELGNEHFKQKKFKEAIDCYSRSIALSPTAVAYANRAMAYLKIKRFQDAEDDCTEALNLDDRYIKAYSRRSTARKELGKLKESIEDSEFALRLEPHNQEIKKQYSEAKSLYEKEILKKASVSSRGIAQKAGKLKVEMNGHNQGIQSVSSSSERTEVAVMPEDHTEGNNGQVLPKKFVEVENDGMITKKREVDASQEDASQTSCLGSAKSNHKTSKEELKASVHELASRAAFLAKAEAAKSILPPNSAFQFEVSWRGLSGDRSLQARLLKIFKNALSAPMLIDIIRCITTFFIEEMDLAVKYLENLTKVSRFDMIIMCLSSTDKLDLVRIWDEVFCNKGTPPLYAEMLAKLRSRYCLKQ